MIDKNKVLVCSTPDSEYFGELLAKQLGLDGCFPVERDTFDGGEKYRRIGINSYGELFGKTAIIVGSTHTDEAFEDLCRLSGGLQNAKRKIFVITFFGYSTMERAVNPGELVMAKERAVDLSKLSQGDYRNVFLMFDLHISGLVHYFEGDCIRHEIYGGDFFVSELNKIFADMYGWPRKEKISKKVKFVSADLGRPYWVQYYADEFETGEIALVAKVRKGKNVKVGQSTGASVQDKDCVAYDDMIRSFKTLIKALCAHLEAGAQSINALVSHLALDGEHIVKLIEESPLQWLIVSNSHPMTQLDCVKNCKKIIVVDISSKFARVIENLIEKE